MGSGASTPVTSPSAPSDDNSCRRFSDICEKTMSAKLKLKSSNPASGKAPKHNIIAESTTSKSSSHRDENRNINIKIGSVKKDIKSPIKKCKKKREIIQICSAEISPRLPNYNKRFTMHSMANSPNNCDSNTDARGNFLACDNKGQLCSAPRLSGLESNKSYRSCEWKILYLDMQWPQQYFHLMNYSQRRIVRCELLDSIPWHQNEGSHVSPPPSPSTHENMCDGRNTIAQTSNARLYTITLEDTEKHPELRDTKLLFYLTRSKTEADCYIINSTFGMCLSHNAEGDIRLEPTPEDNNEKADCLWNFSICT